MHIKTSCFEIVGYAEWWDYNLEPSNNKNNKIHTSIVAKRNNSIVIALNVEHWNGIIMGQDLETSPRSRIFKKSQDPDAHLRILTIIIIFPNTFNGYIFFIILHICRHSQHKIKQA